MIICSELGKVATSEAEKYLLRADNLWWRCAQYCVSASCGYMPKDNRCMYMAHVCFYVCFNDRVGVCGNVVVQRPLLKIVFSLRMWKYVVCLCKGCFVVWV